MGCWGTRGPHAHDHALYALAAGDVLDLALITVDLEVDVAADNPVGGVDLLVLIGAAGVVVGRTHERKVILLFLVLLVGSAGGLKVFQRSAALFFGGKGNGSEEKKDGDQGNKSAHGSTSGFEYSKNR